MVIICKTSYGNLNRVISLCVCVHGLNLNGSISYRMGVDVNNVEALAFNARGLELASYMT
jgi:hypothetical protein